MNKELRKIIHEAISKLENQDKPQVPPLPAEHVMAINQKIKKRLKSLLKRKNNKSMGTELVPVRAGELPPVEIENNPTELCGNPISNNKDIPLSMLLGDQGELVCPICGHILPMEAIQRTDRIIDGQRYECCKVCPTTRKL